MSEGGLPVSLLPDVDTEDMEDLILDRWNQLSEKLKFDAGYAPPQPGVVGHPRGGADRELGGPVLSSRC